MPRHPSIERLAVRDGRFHPDAWRFTGESLRRAVELHVPAGERRHVRAVELLAGAVDLAVERFGLLAPLVLARWGVRSTEDLGVLTFLLVESGVFSRQEDDRPEDFTGHASLEDLILNRARERAGLEEPAR